MNRDFVYEIANNAKINSETGDGIFMSTTRDRRLRDCGYAPLDKGVKMLLQHARHCKHKFINDSQHHPKERPSVDPACFPVYQY